MKWKYVLIVVFLGGVGLLLVFIFTLGLFQAKKEIVPVGVFSLITEPDDGIAPVLTMIDGASSSVDLVMYELDDAKIDRALAVDEARGVAVRVILGAGYDGASSTVNASAYNFLVAHGVPVRWSPAYFSLTHEKSLVVDGSRAFIMTFNLVSKYYPTGRDFGIIDDDAHDVAAMEDTFDADWKGSAAVREASGTASAGNAATAGNDGDRGDDLLWSPGSEASLIDLINGAHTSLYIYNEEMADPAVTKALIDAAERGVSVYVDMTGAAEWKWEFAELTTAGVHVRTYADADDAPLYIHAKVIVVDGGSASARAFVGSENFSAASLDANRELGLVVTDPTIIRSLIKTFAADWRGAVQFRL